MVTAGSQGFSTDLVWAGLPRDGTQSPVSWNSSVPFCHCPQAALAAAVHIQLPTTQLYFKSTKGSEQTPLSSCPTDNDTQRDIFLLYDIWFSEVFPSSCKCWVWCGLVISASKQLFPIAVLWISHGFCSKNLTWITLLICLLWIPPQKRQTLYSCILSLLW